MNITIPNYEILNFETSSLVVSDVGVSAVYSKSLLEALRELQVSKIMTKVELDGVLCRFGFLCLYSGVFWWVGVG